MLMNTIHGFHTRSLSGVSSNIKLRVLALPYLHNALQTGFDLARRSVTLEKLPAADGPGNDPYRMRERIDERPALIVTPRNRGPARILPGAVLGNTPAGIVQADHAVDLNPWFKAMRARPETGRNTVWAVLAMGKNIYLRLGRRITDNLKSADQSVEVSDWLADQYDRDQLCMKLSNGPDLVLYLGHGRTRGWAGYQTIRWRHIAGQLEKPAGIVVAFACRTLSRQHNRIAFGSRWILEGQARTYVGSIADLPIKESSRLAEIFAMQIPCANTIGDLMVRTGRIVGRRSPEGRALASFRIIGDPMCSLRGEVIRQQDNGDHSNSTYENEYLPQHSETG